MLLLDVEQGTPEWHAARLGIPTASEFSKILTSTGKPSTQATTYRHSLIGERLLGRPPEAFESEWMARGRELEAEARQLYELINDVTVEQVGFATTDDGSAGCSPDGLIGDDGGYEVKCPTLPKHVAYLLAGKVPSDYAPQVQGCLYVTGREWWDFMSYYPAIDPLIVRVHRDDKYITALAAALDEFNDKLQAELEKLQ